MKLTPELKLTIRTWAIVLLATLWLAAWCFGIFYFIGDRPPTWGYGTPDVLPGDSRYTTGAKPSPHPVPDQVPHRDEDAP